MADTDVRMLEELDRLELGPDAAGAWDDFWLDGDELVADSPGWWWAA